MLQWLQDSLNLGAGQATSRTPTYFIWYLVSQSPAVNVCISNWIGIVPSRFWDESNSTGYQLCGPVSEMMMQAEIEALGSNPRQAACFFFQSHGYIVTGKFLPLLSKGLRFILPQGGEKENGPSGTEVLNHMSTHYIFQCLMRFVLSLFSLSRPPETFFILFHTPRWDLDPHCTTNMGAE